MDLQVGGMHHVTCVTADPRANRRFYCDVLGLRLVKKTVNQDDVSAYHLFYADGDASPGSDITFFHWPVPRETRGTHSVVETAFRIADAAALDWWRERLGGAGVMVGQIGTRAGRAHLPFEDGEGQRLALVVDGGEGEARTWAQSPVPARYQIRGLGPPLLAVPRAEKTGLLLTAVMNMHRGSTYAGEGPQGADIDVFQSAGGGAAAEVLVMEDRSRAVAPGAGGVHHIAFRTPDRAGLTAWADRLSAIGIPNSGEVERYYFRSLYFREPGGVLFEIATDGPGFAVDEPLASLGEKLSLPPFLEPRRREIEAGLVAL
jgi:glyoxalase family protein